MRQNRLSLWKCPLCGKQNSLRSYNPSDYKDDITVIVKRGLGRGKGFEVVAEYSMLDGDHPELLDVISDRVAVLYDLFYEDEEDDKAEELIDKINTVLSLDDNVPAFDNLIDATEALLGHFHDYEEDVDEDDLEEDEDTEEEDMDDKEDDFEFDEEIVE